MTSLPLVGGGLARLALLPSGMPGGVPLVHLNSFLFYLPLEARYFFGFWNYVHFVTCLIGFPSKEN